jgi:transcriptional regulator
MYIPQAFEERSVPVMHALMESHPFAAVVTAGITGLIATHIPLVLDSDGSELGVLRGHVARANSHWRETQAYAEALVIFSGPEHYISPSWYAAKQEDGRVVPTWNYAVVHAYGPLTVHQDPAWLLRHLNSLVNQHEAVFEKPWKVSDAPPDYVAAQLKAIVGIEIPIRRLEGKWKASQNRSERDRNGVADGLGELNTPESLAMKALVDRR